MKITKKQQRLFESLNPNNVVIDGVKYRIIGHGSIGKYEFPLPDLRWFR